MAVTLVTGALGAGKGLYCSMLARQAYLNGRRVATNYPLNMEKLDNNGSQPVSVIPIHFTYDDLISLGRGCPAEDKVNFGVLFLDEVSLFLNARTFKDAQRAKFNEFFQNSRKYGWDIYLQTQEAFLLDKQIVDGFSEFVIKLSRLDSLRLPFISSFMELIFPKEFGVMAKRRSLLPHIIKYRLYLRKDTRFKTPIESGSFRAKDYFGIHDTLTLFSTDSESQGAYSLLPAKQLKTMSQALATAQGTVINTSTPWTFKSFNAKLKPFYQLLCVLLIPVLLYWYWFGRDNTGTAPLSDGVSTSQAPILPPSLPVSPTAQPTETPIEKPVPLSSTLRLIGHIKTNGQMQLIVKDMSSGVVRYISYTTSNRHQRIESVEIDGEKVTFYSGGTANNKSSIGTPTIASPLPF